MLEKCKHKVSYLLTLVIILLHQLFETLLVATLSDRKLSKNSHVSSYVPIVIIFSTMRIVGCFSPTVLVSLAKCLCTSHDLNESLDDHSFFCCCPYVFMVG